MKFNTKVIHSGVHPDPSTGAIMTPIFQTSTYVQDGPGNHKGFEYARTQNPTRQVLEENLASLENGFGAVCFGSGLAAMDAVIKLLQSGDEVLATNDLYGGSYRQLVRVFGKLGIQSRYIPMQDAADIERQIRPNTRLLWIETPTNPLLNIVDLDAVCTIARNHGLLVCVDNTFASPYLQNPIDFGADLVLHSATKYLGGHSDVVHGAVVAKSRELHEQLKFLQNACGAVPGPMDCFLVLRGIKTLHLRVERACENAIQIASYLEGHPRVSRVLYPGFESHPNHAVAKRQMRGFGAMVSFELKGGQLEDAKRVLAATSLFSCAESLGGVESLIGHPATMTHASIPREERIANGLSDTLIRLSVGVEDAGDLIEDLGQAIGG
ncbi:MAG: PLP-dependent transferase [Saprospiraceae bacterium]|jgi:cystathionine gamma-lyase|nr:PLP-dependent transferase [Saprospiraceae bacterium]MBP9209285.1 PLP-dependent transferase [Saprospiraceae bacterium]MBV6474307.1 Cystathionine gamma-lyase [Saprospiraceae bacterium]